MLLRPKFSTENLEFILHLKLKTKKNVAPWDIRMTDPKIKKIKAKSQRKL